MTMAAAFCIVLGHVAATALIAWLYFRRYQVARPPIGVVNLWDMAFTLGAIVLVPFLYLAVPPWVGAALLGAAALSALYLALEPVLHPRRLLWPAVLALLGADIVAATQAGAGSMLFFAINNVVLVVAVVGTANLWAQSGMRARDLSLLAGALAVYDVIATSRLPLMDDLVTRLSGVPFAPVMAWTGGDEGASLAIGLGDLLFVTLSPLVMRKAFGRRAGIAAMVLAVGAVGAMLALLLLGAIAVSIPAMAVLGPLIVAQHAYWRRRRGRERTTWEYLRAEPLSASARDSRDHHGADQHPRLAYADANGGRR